MRLSGLWYSLQSFASYLSQAEKRRCEAILHLHPTAEHVSLLGARHRGSAALDSVLPVCQGFCAGFREYASEWKTRTQPPPIRLEKLKSCPFKSQFLFHFHKKDHFKINLIFFLGSVTKTEIRILILTLSG